MEAKESDEPQSIVFEDFSETYSKIAEKIKRLSFYKEIFQDIKTKRQIIVEKVDAMISYINNRNRSSYSFSELKKQMGQQQFDKKSEVSNEEIPDIDFEMLSTKVSFYDCFTLTTSLSPIICFSLVSYISDIAANNLKFLNQVIDFPLILIDNKEFLKQNTFICQTYDSEIFKDYIKHNADCFPVVDPITRAELIGGIIPYNFADSWNDFSISCIFLKGKKVKQSFYDLFYFALYRKLKAIESVNQTVVEQLKFYAFERVKNGKSKLTFSSLPLEPKEIVPIPIALLYCTQVSSDMFGESPQCFKMEKLRNFCFTADYIIEILRYHNMDIDEDFIKQRSKLFRSLMKMKGLDEYKRLEFILGKLITLFITT